MSRIITFRQLPPHRVKALNRQCPPGPAKSSHLLFILFCAYFLLAKSEIWLTTPTSVASLPVPPPRDGVTCARRTITKKLPCTLTLRSPHMPSSANRAYCAACVKEKNEKRLIRLTSTCRCTTSPTHMTLWAFGNTVCQSVHMYAASGRYRARPRPQRSLCACEVCGCVGVGWACGSKSWPVYRPAERVRCVTCFANELSWPGRSVGWAY